MNTESLPWHRSELTHLQELANVEKLPHALLFPGLDGSGKTQFIWALAKFLLCLHASELDCQCHSCALFTAGSHPDFNNLGLVEEAKSIKVDAVRALNNKIHQTPAVSRRRVIIINPAQKLNTAASNALLKILEEPPANSYFLLITDQISNMAATVSSRCQQQSLTQPTQDELQSWLSQNNISISDSTSLEPDHIGAFALLDSLSEDKQLADKKFKQNLEQVRGDGSQIILIAQKWLEFNPSWLLEQWIRLLVQRIKTTICEQNGQLQARSLFDFLDKLYTVRKGMNAQHNLNQQMLYESLLIDWREL